MGETDAALDLWTKSAQVPRDLAGAAGGGGAGAAADGPHGSGGAVAAEAYRHDRASTAAEVVNALVMYSMVENGNDDPNLISRTQSSHRRRSAARPRSRRRADAPHAGGVTRPDRPD